MNKFLFIAVALISLALLAEPQFVRAEEVPISSLGNRLNLSLTVQQLQQFSCISKQSVNSNVGLTRVVVDPPANHFHVRPVINTVNTVWLCPNGKKAEILAADKENAPLKWYETTAITIINRIFWVFALVGVWLIQLTSTLLGQLLAVKRFIVHPFVTIGWPFLLGIANLGFILSLLFIAAATTLRLEGYGARRMLPKLLIAALLINFSLVIGGIIIDASRIIMAIMINLLGTTQLENIGADILQASKVLDPVIKINTGANIWDVDLLASATSWRIPLKVLQSTVLIYGLLIGMIVISVGLFIRYIMLILLLIVSPLAYLAIALPNMSGYAATWWKTFLKYVFYGPIALFVLIMITQLGKIEGGFLGAENDDALLDSVFTVAITAAMCIAAATAGSKFGIIGANATVNFVKKAPNAAWRNPKTTAALAGLATGGLGAAAVAGLGTLAAQRAGKGVTNQARDFGNVARTALRNRFGLSKRDDKGNLKTGQTSPGKTLAESTIGRLDPKLTARRREAESFRSMGTLSSGAISAIDPGKLGEEHIAAAIREADKANIKNIGATGSERQVRFIVNNKGLIRVMDDTERSDFETSMTLNTFSTDTKEDARIKGKFLDQLQRIYRELRDE